MHVLGLPPAFALSQDQTLRLDENLNRLITTFDEVRHLKIAFATPWCDLKRVPPKSRPAAPSREEAARKDPAVHVSLSSDSPVKQPGTGRSRPPVNRRAVEARGLRSGSEAWSPNISEELRRRAVAPRRRRAELGLYRR